MSKTRGIGVDMVEIDRIKAIHSRHGQKFLDRVLTANEQAYCKNSKSPYPSIAARVAAKEAVSKAMGVGIGRVLRWTSISVEKKPSGEPKVVLDSAGKRLLKKLKAKEVLLSLSHTGNFAIAMAVVR